MATDTTNSPAPAAGPHVSFVLPVFNEEGNLTELHERICAVMDARSETYEMVFVDDGSSDGSVAELLGLNEKDDRVRIIEFRRNFGKAAAYSAGFDAARGTYVITMDTDLQDDPAEIPLFLDKLEEGTDIVVGWKYEGKGSLEKSLPSRFFNKVVRKLTGIHLHDFNCPFKAYRREVLQEIHVYGELHRYIPVLAASRGFSLAEIQISNLPRLRGTSNYGFERYLRGMLDLITVIFITRFVKRPMHLLAMGGIGAGLMGAAVIAFFLIGHILWRSGLLESEGWRFRDRPLISMAILLIIVGIQFLSMGLLAELFVRGSMMDGVDTGYSVRKRTGD